MLFEPIYNEGELFRASNRRFAAPLEVALTPHLNMKLVGPTDLFFGATAPLRSELVSRLL